MFDDLKDVENIDDESKEIVETDYSEKTLKLRKKMLKTIWVVFVSMIVILVSILIEKHDDFDVVLKSSLFRSFLYVTLAVSLTALVFSMKNRSKSSNNVIYKKYKFLTETLEVLVIIPLFMAVVSLSNEVMISPSFIDGASMEPNYYEGEDILFWHLNVNYERFDVVILKAPTGDYWIKRIIGLPGERVVIDNGDVFINGQEIEQEFLRNENGSIDTETDCRALDSSYCEFEIPENSFFVLGDNRDVSDDSRSESLGFVSEDQLFGKVILKFNNFFRKK